VVGIGGGDVGEVWEVGEAGGNIFRDVGSEPRKDIFMPHSIVAVTGGRGGGAEL